MAITIKKATIFLSLVCLGLSGCSSAATITQTVATTATTTVSQPPLTVITTTTVSETVTPPPTTITVTAPVITTTVTQTITPTTPTPQTFQPITFTGANDTKTPPFTVTTSEWVITWSYQPIPGQESYASFSFFVYPRGDTINYVESVLFPSTTSGSTYSYAGPGDYYLDVTTSSVASWTVTISPAP